MGYVWNVYGISMSNIIIGCVQNVIEIRLYHKKPQTR
jgi:heme exporter protein D